MVSVIVSPVFAYPEFPLVVIAMFESVGAVKSNVTEPVSAVVSVSPTFPAASWWLPQENISVFSLPVSVRTDVHEVPEPLIVVDCPPTVHTKLVTDSLAVIVSVISSPAMEELPEPSDSIAIVRVGFVASCVKANCVAAAVLVLPALSDAAPTATSIVTDSSASVGVNVYVQTVSEVDPAPLPTDPPARERVGAALRVSAAVTITVYVPLLPYCPLVTPVTAMELMVGATLS